MTPTSVHNPRSDVRGYISSLLRHQLDTNLPLIRTHLMNEPLTRTSLYRAHKSITVILATSDVYRSRSDVRKYRALTSSTTTIQKNTTRHADAFSGQPCARGPSNSIDVRPKTTQSNSRVFRPRRGVRSNNSRLAATRQFLPMVSRTASVKIGTRPRHKCADVEMLLENAIYSYPSTLAFTCPAQACKEARHSIF